jgi:hypothetical protein
MNSVLIWQNYFSSSWFMVALFMAAFLFIYGIVFYLMRDRYKQKIHDLAEEEKMKQVQTFSKVISIFKILFWMLPVFYVFIIPPVYSLDPQAFYMCITCITIMYLAALESYLLFKFLLKIVDK